MLVSCVLAALSTVFAIAPYLLFYYALTAFLDGDGGRGWFCIGAAATALPLQPICFGLSTGIAHGMAFDTLHDLRIALLRKLARLPLGYFSSRRSGALKRIVNENVEVMELFFSHQLPDMIAAMLMPVATLLLLAVVDWRLGLAAAGIIPIVWLANILMMRGHGDKIGQYFGMMGRINAAFVEYLQGIDAIKISAVETMLFGGCGTKSRGCVNSAPNGRKAGWAPGRCSPLRRQRRFCLLCPLDWRWFWRGARHPCNFCSRCCAQRRSGRQSSS